MNLRLRHISDVLHSTALCGFAAFFLIAEPAHAVDAITNPEAQQYSRLRSHLSSPAPVSFPEATATASRSLPSENLSTGIEPLPPAVIPPAYPPAYSNAAPVLPPVDAATAARAEQELLLQAQLETPPVPVVSRVAPTENVEPMQAQGFIAPAPLAAATPVDGAPAPMVVNPTPVVSNGAPEPLAAPDALSQPVTLPPIAFSQSEVDPVGEELTPASKKIISKIPSKLDQTAKTKGGKMAVKRMSPALASLVDNSGDIETYDSVGLSIKVQRPGLDSNFELNRAYTAVMGGETSQAIDIYKNILSSEPNNQDALFGLASLYHRNGDLDKARPLYGRLLKANPDHREGLNNFLILISDEAPLEALAELERLEARNPDFSPIPAQQSLLLKKLGYMDRAQDKMLRAIELAPDNLSYKYNLAVILDTTGHYTDASALYRLLIDAATKGEKLPVSIEILQKRLNYIASVPVSSGAVGG